MTYGIPEAGFTTGGGLDDILYFKTAYSGNPVFWGVLILRWGVSLEKGHLAAGQRWLLRVLLAQGLT